MLDINQGTDTLTANIRLSFSAMLKLLKINRLLFFTRT